MVTILIPVYNSFVYLQKCIDSVTGQTYSNLQIVMIDDGSTDESLYIMQEYAAKDSRIEIYHQENQGVASTRNNLLDRIRGDYVLFVDADDWLELDMVDHLVRLADKYNSTFVMCGRLINDAKPNHSVTTINVLSQEQAVCDFLHHEYFVGSLWNKLLGSSLLHNERFHCGIWYGEDALFTWNVLQKVDNVVVTNRQLYHYQMNDESISHQSFGEKKLTGHETWRILTEETNEKWHKYLHIAEARWGMEDFYLLRQAAQCSYKKNDKIVELQKTVKQFIPQMKKCGLLSMREYVNVIITCRWYEYGYLYFLLHRLIKR